MTKINSSTVSSHVLRVYNVNNIDVFIAAQKIEMKFKQTAKCEMEEHKQLSMSARSVGTN